MVPMTKREKNVVIGILAVCAAGLLFLTLNRYSFYQNYIDLTPPVEVSREARDGTAAKDVKQS